MEDLIEKMKDDNNIIVLINVNNNYYWYVSERHLWLMNYEKYVKAFDESDDDYSERFDIGILDDKNVTTFQEYIKEDLVAQFHLGQAVRKALLLTSWDEDYYLFPSLYIDFTKKELYSVYSESISFENYVPNDWKGCYEDFYDIVPNHIKYWVIDKEDIFKELS
ncbi:MAG: hypothetical protein ACFB0B_06255 [Thermonemataceae bacterium]